MAWTDQLDELLLANEGKAARERLTLINYSRNCVAAATAAATMQCSVTPDGGAQTWALDARPAAMLTFAPGEAYQFDTDHEIVLLVM